MNLIKTSEKQFAKIKNKATKRTGKGKKKKGLLL
jgi:hypothetical protein